MKEGSPKNEEKTDTNTSDAEDEALTRYVPQHPLPEEIRKLAKDDTVCKYCGVSYLIHSEMKALEEKLKVAEKELAILRGQEKREELLKQEKSILQQQKKELEDSLHGNTQLIASLNKELEEKTELLKKSEETSAGYKKKYLSTLRQFSALSQTVRQQKKDLQDISQTVREGKSEMFDLFSSLREQLMLIKEKAAIEKSALESRVDCLDMEKVVISEANKNLTERLKATEQELQRAKAEVDQKSGTLVQMEQNMLNADQLKAALTEAENALQGMNKELEESSAKCKILSVEMDQYKIQLRSKTTDVHDLTNKLKQAEQNHEVALQKAQLELKSKEGELITCLKQLKSLENKWREQQRKEDELSQQSQLSQNETFELRENLRRTKGDIEALKAERELMIQAHQNRIEDLRESFKNKMSEAENWPQKLQAAVSAEKTRHLAEMKALEDNLKHNFVLKHGNYKLKKTSTMNS